MCVLHAWLGTSTGRWAFQCKSSWMILQIPLLLTPRYKIKWNFKKIKGWGDLCVFLWGENIFCRSNFCLLSIKGRKSWCIQLAQCDCFCHCSVICVLRDLAHLIFNITLSNILLNSYIGLLMAKLWCWVEFRMGKDNSIRGPVFHLVLSYSEKLHHFSHNQFLKFWLVF